MPHISWLGVIGLYDLEMFTLMFSYEDKCGTSMMGTLKIGDLSCRTKKALWSMLRICGSILHVRPVGVVPLYKVCGEEGDVPPTVQRSISAGL